MDDIRGNSRIPLPGVRRLKAHGLFSGKERLAEYFIPKKARDIYRELKLSPMTRRLGQIADVGIGYVTGANEFFHLAPHTIWLWGIPKEFLRPAVRRGRALVGLRFTEQDWQRALDSGESGYLLYINSEADLPESVQRYLKNGEKQGVSKAYKCRTRSPWYCVPHVHMPDAFLSYMSGSAPRLVADDAGAVAPNSLHVLRLHPQAAVTSDALAALWQTSLSRLSAEIEGHSLGGGMLKIEPTEAENVVVAMPQTKNGDLKELAEKLDALARTSGDEIVQSSADAVVLKDGIGLTARECSLLQTAADKLRQRRYSRSVTA